LRACDFLLATQFDQLGQYERASRLFDWDGLRVVGGK
jgi:hypothetical protein